MSTPHQPQVWELLLTRRGLVYARSSGAAGRELSQAAALELAGLGYSMTAELRDRLARCTSQELTELKERWSEALLRHVGGNHQHEPLFRKFPRDVPTDTRSLWWKRFLVHFVQAPNQACIHCSQTGCTHVLSPCEHVVCGRCFDGSNYSGCPICGGKVDTQSPFFLPSEERPSPKERVRFKLLRLGHDLDADARRLFESLCARPQALNPDDRDALLSLLEAYGPRVLQWIPAKIPLRENIATVFATLFGKFGGDDPDGIFEVAKQHMTTATDVLRFVAVLSGTDGSLQAETIRPQKRQAAVPAVHAPTAVKRFRVAKLNRRTRRALLGLLESFDADRLGEDLLRHRSYWVWVGEFLHPHEYAKRFPKVAAGFQAVRRKDPEGRRAPKFRSWNSRVELAIAERDVPALINTLPERPGEFGRRLDHVLSSAPNDETRGALRDAFRTVVPRLPTPMLLTLFAHFRQRHVRQAVRVYWPKGQCAYGASTPDKRPLLPRGFLDGLCSTLQTELLSRFSQKPRFDTVLVDRALDKVVVPFNERTASRAAVSLPRGSQVSTGRSDLARLFLHWCQPEGDRDETDLDLSVGFYRDDWSFAGTCSYYELQLRKSGELLAQSAGDFTDAPHPQGATEFVDIHCDVAARTGVRYAVVVINAYSGLPFGVLQDAFAGLMLRDDEMGSHFDPRTVELRFDLQGDNGIYLPLCFDIHDRRLHWLDVSAKGQFALNNVATSNKSIQRLVPDLMNYFGSGVRPSMFTLGVLHGAARCDRIAVRDAEHGAVAVFERKQGENDAAFAHRVEAGEGGTSAQRVEELDLASPLALLYRGDIDLPDNAAVYALFRGHAKATLWAADLLS